MKRTCCLLVGLFLLASPAAASEPRVFDSNGVKLQYLVEGQGEAVVLIHGFAVNHQLQWVRPGIFKELARDFQVITLDNRGHGKSDKPHDPKQYGTELVTDVIRLLDHLQVKRAHFVGYSMGAYITLKLVTMHPDRVLSATLGGAGRHVDGDEKWLDQLADSLESGKGFGPLLLRLAPVGKPKPEEGDLKLRSALIGTLNDTKALAALVRNGRALMVTDEELKANKVPVFGMVGSLDPLKVGLDALQGRMNNYSMQVISGGDHMNAFLYPEFTTHLRGFLAKHRENK